jgi:hypothetical protein
MDRTDPRPLAPWPVLSLAGAGLAAALAAVLVGWQHPPRQVAAAALSGSAGSIRYLPGWPGWALLSVLCAAAAVVAWAEVGRRVFFTSPGGTVARLALGGGALAAGAAVAGTLAMAAVGADGSAADQRLAWAVQALAFGTVLLLALSAPVAVSALLAVALRSARAYWLRRDFKVDCTQVMCGDEGTDCVPGERTWTANRRLPPGREVDATGICVSGGGIRSATFSLGALQEMQAAGELGASRYLIGVSGGGYAAGALRLAFGRVPGLPAAAQPAAASGPPVAVSQPAGTAVPDPTDVFADGSPEFHHVRRHSKYLAEGAGEWLVALGVVLRGLLVVQLILLVAAMLLGRLIGQAYSSVPALGQLLDEPWRVPAGLGWAVAGAFGLAMLAWLVGVFAESMTGNDGVSSWLRSVAAARVRPLVRPLAQLGLAMIVVVVVLPVLVKLSSVVNDWYHTWARSSDTRPATATTTGAAGILTTAYLASLAGIFLAARKSAGSAIGWAKANRATLRYIPVRVLQWLLVSVSVLVLVVTHVYVFARILHDTTSAHRRPGDNWRGLLPQWWIWLAVVIFVLLALLIDQTRWSLHPYYKERLMTAFAVRRAAVTDDRGAVPYDFANEPTPLAEYCSRVDGFPQVILVAAANVSGSELTAPGRRALPYTLSGDWIGSPRLGWITPQAASGAAARPLRDDLTMQAAMAISGAAFASAMGASGRPYSVLFAMTNARLGTWLPNPYFLHKHRDALTKVQRWHLPRPPGWRRLHYLVREVLGIHPWDGRLLLATDGGHYENLGLVELLRHFPRVAYCFDASGGSSLEAGALAAAIGLAHEELGIRIDFHGRTADVEPGMPRPAADGARPAGEPAGGGGKPAGGGGAVLPPERLARTCVLVGTIQYPRSRPDGVPAEGRLYLGKAVLTADTPWEVQAYAREHPLFPNDHTSDQWFDHTRFDAYHALGQHVARCVLAAAQGQGDAAGPVREPDQSAAAVAERQDTQTGSPDMAAA